MKSSDGMRPDPSPDGDPWADIRDGVRKLCARFPGTYWQVLDRDRTYPEAFVAALTEAGYLACLIPEQYGGAGPRFRCRRAVSRSIHRSGTGPPVMPRCT